MMVCSRNMASLTASKNPQKIFGFFKTSYIRRTDHHNCYFRISATILTRKGHVNSPVVV